jgi:hypothetical protein
MSMGVTHLRIILCTRKAQSHRVDSRKEGAGWEARSTNKATRVPGKGDLRLDILYVVVNDRYEIGNPVFFRHSY